MSTITDKQKYHRKWRLNNRDKWYCYIQKWRLSNMKNYREYMKNYMKNYRLKKMKYRVKRYRKIPSEHTIIEVPFKRTYKDIVITF